jgi:hypothetical protein
MEAIYRVGQKVSVDIGGCPENRTRGVVTSVRRMPALITYEVDFPEFPHDPQIEKFYMAEYLHPIE